MLYEDLTAALGYAGSSLFREDDGADLIAPSDRHWIRTAREAGARGSYFFRTSPSPGAVRPAVHVAEARTSEEAREIHRRLWNQGINPFIIIVLPGEVRVFTGFAFHPTRTDIGEIRSPLRVESDAIALIAQSLSTFSSDSINRGDIWQSHARHLGSDRRVDTTLLAHLQTLSGVLQKQHGLTDKTSHALIGKFVYLSYLRARDILSDKWLLDEAELPPHAVFTDKSFCASVALESFRTLAKKVESRFNGRLFPIPWGSRRAPRADAIRTVARVFAGEDVLSGQLHLPFTAYDFSYIPVEFLSSIYEQFLHAEGLDAARAELSSSEIKEQKASNPEKQGAHYTPEPLADYLVSEVDSVYPLKAGMKILDPCCGSGVFLVVAFRRLVELECERQRRASLHASELKALLETSIYGVERNLTACQITGFSLILALLSYVEPPELHRRKTFKFPSLIGTNLFNQDFFDESGGFWRKADSAAGKNLVFDWIIGNPPWVELDATDPKAQLVLGWSKRHSADYGLARARTGEAFAWRVMDCLAGDGVVGLILHAKSLTNDHLAGWRKKFFSSIQVHRVTNFANLAYVIFASAKQPAATIIYSRRSPLSATSFVHVGPFVVNQCALAPRRNTKRRAWTIGFSESEIKMIPAANAVKGDATTWKLALWGNQRDELALRRLRQVFSTRLGKLAESLGWSISLGLQLRKDGGSASDPNQYEDKIEGLKVLDHKALIRSGPTLRIQPRFLENNQFGCYIRRGRLSGLKITTGPRLLLWNDFAAYGDIDFIIRHDKVGLSGGSNKEMKAIAAIWNSSYVAYLLFFVTSAAWGIGVSQIDKGDAENLPFPEFTPGREEGLATAWDEAAALEGSGESFYGVKEFLDQRVASLLDIPDTVSLVVRDFFRVRYELNQGKAPKIFLKLPDEAELHLYAARVRKELDNFLGGAGHHRITVLYSGEGVVISITLTRLSFEIEPVVRLATGGEKATLRALLESAESQFSQWAYVKRSIRIFDGDTIHLIKPPRRLEWTETNALLDADDIIAEVIEAQLF
ncbi:MAG TPA: DNA methyltransferase [Thermoanaerobaculia bacterium]|nr:DNA methyltransferase [Thermoanaerobaculia bacterium]